MNSCLRLHVLLFKEKKSQTHTQNECLAHTCLQVWLTSLLGFAELAHAGIMHPTPPGQLQLKNLIYGTHPSNLFLYVIDQHPHFLWKLMF